MANLHAINFALGTDAYRAQLDAIATELSHHRGPIVVAGDFNTWNDERDAVWAHPDLMPTAEDLENPSGFVQGGGTDLDISDLDEGGDARKDEGGDTPE